MLFYILSNIVLANDKFSLASIAELSCVCGGVFRHVFGVRISPYLYRMCPNPTYECIYVTKSSNLKQFRTSEFINILHFRNFTTNENREKTLKMVAIIRIFTAVKKTRFDDVEFNFLRM